MLGFDAISTSPLSSFSVGRTIHIRAIEDLSLATFEVVDEEDGVRIKKIINILDSVKAFRDWEDIHTGAASHWNKIQINGSVNWQDLDAVKRNRKSS